MTVVCERALTKPKAIPAWLFRHQICKLKFMNTKTDQQNRISGNFSVSCYTIDKRFFNPLWSLNRQSMPKIVSVDWTTSVLWIWPWLFDPILSFKVWEDSRLPDPFFKKVPITSFLTIIYNHSQNILLRTIMGYHDMYS